MRRWIGPLLCGHARPNYAHGLCQTCWSRDYRRSPSGKAANARFRQSDKGKALALRHRIDECVGCGAEKPIEARGLCNGCYQRWYSHGKPFNEDGTPDVPKSRWVGRYTHDDGYVMVQVPPDDPFASMRKANGYVLEHRYVKAREIGRALRRDETVNHINGIRDDNRPENLQLRQGNHGKGQVAVCRPCGSYDIVYTPIADAA